MTAPSTPSRRRSSQTITLWTKARFGGADDNKVSPKRQRPARRRRSDGKQANNAILDEAARLPTIKATTSPFAAEVLEPASSTSSGVDRLRRLVDAYLRYAEVETLPAD